MRVVVGTFTLERMIALARKDKATLVVSTRRQACIRRGRVAYLTPGRFQMLLAMVAGTQRLVTKKVLVEALWGDREDGGPASDKIIDVTLCNLRKEIAPLGVFIETEFRQGWRMWGDTAPGDKVHERPARAEALKPAMPPRREPAFMVGVR
jgi:DNA-binding response OmpR family regulator